jgi:hypothetical protein
MKKLTPEEKAKALYEKFARFAPAEEKYEHEYTIKMAITCCDEMIKQLSEMCVDGDSMQVRYWNKVKDELNKMQSVG